MIRSRFFFLVCVLASFAGFAQFTVTSLSADTFPAYYAKRVLMGGGIAVNNVKYKGMKKSIGTFKAADKKIVGLDAGLIMSTGNASKINGPNAHSNYTTSAGEGGYMLSSDKDLKKVIKAPLFDMCLLEFDFTPVSNHLSFEYVFASEEYPEYVGSPFNDIFCFFINEAGDTLVKNIALVPGTTNIPISINKVNEKKNGEYFRRNYDENMKFTNSILHNQLEFDGLTKVLTASCDVIPYHVYHMKLVIADASDGDYDSGVFIKANSFASTEDAGGKYYDVVTDIKKKKIRFNPDSIFKAAAKGPDEIREKEEPKTATEVSDERIARVTIYFDTDKSDLKKKEQTKLDSLMKSWSVKDFSRIELYGFTDSVGSRESNQKLAYKRDASIRSYFIGRGMDPEKVLHNETEFLKEADSNETEKGRARNRRVEVVFYRRTK